MSDESDRRAEYEQREQEKDRKAKMALGGVFLLIVGGCFVALLTGGWDGLRIALGILCCAIALAAIVGFIGATELGGNEKETMAGCLGVCICAIVALVCGGISINLLFGI